MCPPFACLTIRFTGLRVNTGFFPRCASGRNPDDCPSRSVVGTGFITNATGASNNKSDKSIACNAALSVINNGNNRATIFVEGSPQSSDPRTRCAIELSSPIPARFVRRGSATALEFDVPQSLLHPLPTLDNAVTSVTSTVRRVTVRRRGRLRGFFESTGGCRNGRRQISVVFTPETGTPTTASTNARCSR